VASEQTLTRDKACLPILLFLLSSAGILGRSHLAARLHYSVVKDIVVWYNSEWCGLPVQFEAG